MIKKAGMKRRNEMPETIADNFAQPFVFRSNLRIRKPPAIIPVPAAGSKIPPHRIAAKVIYLIPLIIQIFSLSFLTKKN